MSTLPLSVVIPTCGRDDLLARCLESLAPGVPRADAVTYEVIVTEDGREKTTEATIRAQFPWAQSVQGPAANRNNGARQARADWICFIDDDCIEQRNSWHDLQRWNAPKWRSRWFRFVLRWLAFPLRLASCPYWVDRFHRQLTAARK